MRKSASVAIGLLVVLMAVGIEKARGQAVYGSILGTVTDSSGAAVPNAKVTITDMSKEISYATTTNESGNYAQTHLIVGKYRVRVEAPGFQAYLHENIEVNVDVATRLDATLQVGAVTQTVSVTAEVPLLTTERAEVATTFNEKSVVELPIFNRNFTQFELLTPGTQRLMWQHASSENPQGSIQIMVNGQHFSGTSYQLDGTDNRDPILGIIVINPNLDAVTEAKITSQNYDAEFGQATAGVVTAQTKSGTNDLHGSAFWFRRDNNFAARNPFSQATPFSGNRFLPDTLINQIGGSLGGPIKKNKSFIFGDYQLNHRTNGGSVLTRAPSAAERTGDLRDLGVNIFDPYMTTDATHSTLVLVSGNPVPLAPSARTQFPNNTIPASRLSPQAQKLLAFLPAGTCPKIPCTSPNFSASGSEVFNSSGFDVRADQYQTEKLHLFGRFSLQQFKRAGPGAFGEIAGGPAFDNIFFAGKSDVRNQSLAGGFDYTYRPDWLTDFRFGFYRYRVFVNPNGLGTSPAKDAGIPNLNLDTTFNSGMPAFFINGTGGFNFGYSLGNNQCNCPLDEEENQWQFVNNWTHIRGNHSIKMGADIRYAQNLRVPSDKHRAGEVSFNSDGTRGPTGGGLGIATFLLGNVNFFERFVSNSTDAAERQKRWFFYGQDTWRFTPKLTFNYGVRWEVYFPQTVTGANKGGFVNPATGEVWVAGTQGIGLNGNVENTFTNFAPRLGIAYQIKPKTVLRMGYGRSFDIGVFGSVFGHSVTQNIPVLASQQTQGPNGNPYETAFTLAQGPPLLDPAAALNNNCNKITDPTGTKTQCLGATGRPLLPDGINSYVLPFKMRLPYVDSWNATFQHQLTPTISVDAAYVGNKGTHVFAGLGPDYNFNQPSEVGFVQGVSANQRKPFFSRYGWTQGFRYFGSDSNNNFNSLQAKVVKRFSSGYSILAHYTWARTYFHDGDYWPVDGRVEYGPNDFQRNHVFLLDNIVELPIGKGKKYLGDASRQLDLLVGGWQINAVTNWESGLPFTPSYQDCGADRDNGPCRPDLVGAVSSNRVGPPDGPQYQWITGTGGQELAANGQTIGPWRRPVKGAFGNLTRNSFRGPHLFNTDLSLFKNFKVTEKLRGQFRAESFNFWNHVNLGGFSGLDSNCVDCSDAGKFHGIQQGTNMRIVQFAVRLDF